MSISTFLVMSFKKGTDKKIKYKFKKATKIIKTINIKNKTIKLTI